jgi:tetratricopeptide (TPR) repeat protein
MESFTPIINSEYKRYAELLLRHHYILCAGIEESEEIESIEDEMAAIWDRLDEIQRASLAGLGSDQNWVRRNGEPAPNARKREEVTEQEKRSLDRSIQSHDWHSCLYYIRICQSWYSKDSLATIRSVAWMNLGLPEIATPFLDFAAKLQPKDGIILFQSLANTLRFHPKDALERAGKIVEQPDHHPILAVVFSILILAAKNTSVLSERDILSLRNKLKSSLVRLKIESPDNPELVIIFQFAGDCYVALDQIYEAIQCYEKGLSIEPENTQLLFARSVLLSRINLG